MQLKTQRTYEKQAVSPASSTGDPKFAQRQSGAPQLAAKQLSHEVIVSSWHQAPLQQNVVVPPDVPCVRQVTPGNALDGCAVPVHENPE